MSQRQQRFSRPTRHMTGYYRIILSYGPHFNKIYFFYNRTSGRKYSD